VAIVEQICRAGYGGSFLHDDYPHIPYLEVKVGIDVERVDRRRQHGGRGQREDLVRMAERLGVWEEETMGEGIFKIGIEGVRCPLGVGG